LFYTDSKEEDVWRYTKDIAEKLGRSAVDVLKRAHKIARFEEEYAEESPDEQSKL